MRAENRKYILTSTEIVKRYKISYQTLNYYTNLGLLHFNGRRGNKRLYDERKLKVRLRRIQKLKNAGFPLGLIRKIINRER
jgi:DNA-binding transcriptional MerR regulator